MELINQTRLKISYLICLIIIFIIFITLFLPVMAKTENKILLEVWFSGNKIFSNQVVRLYVSLINQTDYDVSGTLELYNNNVLLSKRDVLLVSGKPSDWWFTQDRSFLPGDNMIKAQLINTFIHKIGKPPREFIFKSTAFEKMIFIDQDTDGDGIGDLEDADIDGDGISNEEEILLGLNPKMKNSELEIKIAREKFKNKDKSKSSSGEKEDKLLDTVIPSIPKYITEPLKKSDQIVGGLSEQIAKELIAKRKKLLKEIEIRDLSDFNIPKKIYTSFLSGLIFVLENKIILYPISIFIIYKLIRLLFRRRK